MTKELVTRWFNRDVPRLTFRKWTADEEERLKQFYPNTSSKELSHIFNRPENSIRHKGIRLGIKRYYSDFSSKLCRGEATEFELGWITALIEGEGSIHFTNGRKYPRPAIYIINTNRDILEKARSIMGGFIYLSHPQTATQRTCYSLQLGSCKAVYNTLRILAPNFIVKREVSELMLQFCEARLANFRQAPYSDEQRNICEYIYRANKRGVEKDE